MKMRGVAAAASLFFLTPLVAEYLLGDIPLTNVGALVALGPMYGGGAILIRETLRRTKRGWPSFVLLALAYAVMEEALVSQSLFDPHYLGLHLLAYGYLPALGTAFPWVVYVLGIHVIWSMAVPIGLTEALFAGDEAEPWLGKIGLGVTVALLLFGATAAAVFTRHSGPYRDSAAQIACALAVIALLIVAAFRVPRVASTPSSSPAPIALVGGACFLLGSAFLLLYGRGASLGWPWPLTVWALLLAGGLMILLFWWATRQRTWNARTAWAAATGGMLVYAWYGYLIEHDFGHDYDIVPHSILVAFFLLLAIGGGLKVMKQAHGSA